LYSPIFEQPAKRLEKDHTGQVISDITLLNFIGDKGMNFSEVLAKNSFHKSPTLFVLV
jgi:hypothetical protein